MATDRATRKTTPVTPEEALPGRSASPFLVPQHHEVLPAPLQGPWPEDAEVLFVAMGCFWGAERIFWQQPGVISTAAGYLGGYTAFPTYEETCTGRTGHTEAVQVVYDPSETSAELLLKAFWENHDPTTANRQGNDVGTQYRSGIYWTSAEQERAALLTREAFQAVLQKHGHGEIVTEIIPLTEAGDGTFYYAEDYHQQYLHKNPGGYCNHGFKGMTCPVGLVRQDQLPSQQEIMEAAQRS
ncbi:peptide-methionine (S)-S-oxide reductase MsrA [Bogoriella caseilytica]|uniref:Peptide methionine sulfoxide reductase MsrA n=1 Tax=Bogoriella caseilytica TaxID=56055 RepID=A0A3N2BAC5_9MICO|nr:peptide-methionine (S)-S-oxide reductase MsrA [Bogoriella caseilytica]ROR72216.1 peptide-methionine (S)-S-oxide reductase [Bogoriella caseilytica]